MRRHLKPKLPEPSAGSAVSSAGAVHAANWRWCRLHFVVSRQFSLSSTQRAKAINLFVLFIVTVGLGLAGCKPHAKQSVNQFKFVDLWMSINDITNRVGQPDRGYRGQYRLRYDLEDGTEMVIAAHEVREYAPDNLRVYWFGQSRNENWLWLKQTEGDLSHYLQWTQGTAVTVYMHGVNRAAGSLVSVSPDSMQVRDSDSNLVSCSKYSVLWVEKNIH